MTARPAVGEAAGGTLLRAAIVGTGRIAHTYDDETVHLPDVGLPPGVVHANMYGVKPVSHAGAYRTTAGYSLVAAASRGRERLESFGRRHGVRALYTDVPQMLAAERPDVVSVCVQSPQKHEVVLACAEAGVRAVVVEKAFATSLVEADKMLAACARSGTFVATHHPMRFSLMYRRARELTHNGAIGELGAITCHSSGSLVHGGTHWFDLVRFLGGEVASVLADVPDVAADAGARSALEGTYPDLRGHVLLTLRSGVRALVSLAGTTSGGTVVRGRSGYLTLPVSTGVFTLTQTRERTAAESGLAALKPEGRGVRPVVWDEAVPAWPESAAAGERSSTQRMLTELHQALTGKAPFVSTGADGAAALELAIACYHSHLAGGPVTLPLQERRLTVLNR